MLKSEFLEEVAKEARALKENATKKELSRLNLKVLDPIDPEACIYGQMTGGCANSRSKYLISVCCTKMTDSGYGDINPVDLYDEGRNRWVDIRPHINGETDINRMFPDLSPNTRVYSYLSMIETYICMKDAKNKNLIEFLKGEREDLSL